MNITRLGGHVSDYISVKIVSVRELLSGAYVFHLPWFQRAYAWHTVEVGRLLSNLLEVLRSDQSPQRYFLGKLMLAKPDTSPDTALVDGHQRVMTLTLLFSVLRDLETDAEHQNNLHSFVANGQCHLRPHEVLSNFTYRYVQAPGATRIETDDALSALCDTQRNIIENRDYLRVELGQRDIDQTARRDLAKFIGDNCFIMICAVADEDEAWKILQIEEDTRLEFNETDRAKATILSIIPTQDRDVCAKHWEASHMLLGATDMHALLQHLRVLRLRRLSDKPVETDLARAYALDVMGQQFMTGDLVPAAQIVARLRAGAIGHRRDRSAIATHIAHMTWVDANHWIPAALNWLLRRDENAPDTATFFRLLERLVWMMRIAGVDPIKRQRHMLRLLGEIDKGGSPDTLHELTISRAMRDAALENLRAATFDTKHYASRLLRRISVAMGQDPGPIHADHVTLEHILPRSSLPNSPWRGEFSSKKAVQAYAHRLGNLTFLTPTDNQAADTLDWNAKRRILSGSKFLMSKRAGTAKAWNAAQIEARSEDLIRILMQSWNIPL